MSIIVKHHLDLRHLIINVGIVHHRNQVVDDAAVAPPLGLGSLPGVVYDVWIDVRQIGYGDVWEA